MWRRVNTYTVLMRLYISSAIMENCREVPQKNDKYNYHKIQPSDFCIYISKGSEINMLKRYLHSRVHCSIITDSQVMEST